MKKLTLKLIDNMIKEEYQKFINESFPTSLLKLPQDRKTSIARNWQISNDSKETKLQDKKMATRKPYNDPDKYMVVFMKDGYPFAYSVENQLIKLDEMFSKIKSLKYYNYRTKMSRYDAVELADEAYAIEIDKNVSQKRGERYKAKSDSDLDQTRIRMNYPDERTQPKGVTDQYKKLGKELVEKKLHIVEEKTKSIIEKMKQYVIAEFDKELEEIKSGKSYGHFDISDKLKYNKNYNNLQKTLNYISRVTQESFNSSMWSGIQTKEDLLKLSNALKQIDNINI